MNKKIIIPILIVLLLVAGGLYWWSMRGNPIELLKNDEQSIKVIDASDVLQGEIDENTKIPPPLTKDQLIFDPYSGRRGAIIVKDVISINFKNGVSEETINRKIESINGEIIGYDKTILLYDVKLKNSPSLKDFHKIIEELNKDPDIDGAIVEFTASALEPNALPNDPKMDSWNESKPSGKNWGLEAIYAPSAWDNNGSLTKVKIGIIEFGFYTNHEDLNIAVADKKDNVGREDNINHATHVAGIIGATTNNGIGVSGVVWNKDLIGFNVDGEDWLRNLIPGIEYLLHDNVKIINISLALKTANYTESEIKINQLAFTEKLKELAAMYDFLIIQGAGNAAIDAKREVIFNPMADEQFTSAKKNIITVGGIENDNGHYRLARYEFTKGSNYGDIVDIVAPGKEIYSTLWNEDAGVSWWKFWEKEAPLTTCFDGFNSLYGCKQGTSMAAPFVTGVAGLIWGADPSLTAAQVKEIIVNSADRPITYKDKEYKILNAKKSVEFALGESKKLAEQETKEEIQPSDLTGQITNATSSAKAASQSPIRNDTTLDKATAEKVVRVIANNVQFLAANSLGKAPLGGMIGTAEDRLSDDTKWEDIEGGYLNRGDIVEYISEESVRGNPNAWPQATRAVEVKLPSGKKGWVVTDWFYKGETIVMAEVLSKSDLSKQIPLSPSVTDIKGQWSGEWKGQAGTFEIEIKDQSDRMFTGKGRDVIVGQMQSFTIGGATFKDKIFFDTYYPNGNLVKYEGTFSGNAAGGSWKSSGYTSGDWSMMKTN